jgi:hypothetical protein
MDDLKAIPYQDNSAILACFVKGQNTLGSGGSTDIEGSDGSITVEQSNGAGGQFDTFFNSTNTTINVQDINSLGSLISKFSDNYLNMQGNGTAQFTAFNPNGTTEYQQTVTTPINGQVTESISGSGDSAYINGAAITMTANSQATINGASKAVSIANGVMLTTGSADMTIKVGANDTDTVNGVSGVHIGLSTNDNLTTGGSGIIVNVGAGQTDTVTGVGGDILTLANNDVLTTFGAGLNLRIGANETENVVAAPGESLNVAGGGILTLTASNGSITAAGTGAQTYLDGGTNDFFTGSGNSYWLNNATSEKITGSNNTITQTSTPGAFILTLDGSGDATTLNGSAGNQVYQDGGANDTLYASGALGVDAALRHSPPEPAFHRGDEQPGRRAVPLAHPQDEQFGRIRSLFHQ